MITSIKAHAKINLALNVFSRRENGYHDVDMITIPLALHDTIELEALPLGYESFITSDDNDLPTDESNLSYVAFTRMKELFNINKNFMINIYKRIPICAGLGGGSADAAAVINITAKKLKLKIDSKQLIDIAKNIGGDVAFCLFNKPARCKGIGEELEFISLKKKYHVLLIKPLIGVSTAETYQNYDKLEKKPEMSNIDLLIEALKNDDDEIIAREMKNGLQASAIKLVPEIGDIIQKLKDDGFNMTMMSGSGSTVFAMHKDLKLLMNEAKKFDKNKYQVILTSTL